MQTSLRPQMRSQQQGFLPGGSQQVSPGVGGGVGNQALAGQMQGQQVAGAANDELTGFGQAAASATSSQWNEVVAGNRLLRRGASGDAVEDLQEFLIQHGQQIQVDGDFGPATERAVRAVQAQLGVTVDGIVGGGTARALTGQSPQPARGDQNADQTEESGPTTDTSAATTLEEINVSAGSFERTGLRSQVFAKALGTGELLFHEYVTHGSGSDRDHDGNADRMSNVNGSNSSNVGLLRTAETYHGRHGESLRLDGLEAGFNDNARQRAIVMHTASYASDSFRQQHGKMGRSQGCPALDPDVGGDIIRTVKGGTLVFGYYPDPQWLQRSQYLNN